MVTPTVFMKFQHFHLEHVVMNDISKTHIIHNDFNSFQMPIHLNMMSAKAAFTRDLLEPFCMELIGTAWNWSHWSTFTRDRFQTVPRALLNHKYFSRQRRRHLFSQNKGRNFFNSIVKDLFCLFPCVNNE